MLTDKLFTGQREMADLDIYHYGARFYEPTLGRFLSPDTIIPSYANPQSLNRFSYVTNNPLRYTDPTGHRQCEEYAGTCLSEKQETKKNEADRQRKREKKHKLIVAETTSEQTCADCGIEAIEGIFHVAEGLAFAALSLYALGAVLAVGPEGLIAAPIFLTTALVGINFAMFGAQEIQYAVTNGTSAEPDPIPLVHLVFPDFMK